MKNLFSGIVRGIAQTAANQIIGKNPVYVGLFLINPKYGKAYYAVDLKAQNYDEAYKECALSLKDKPAGTLFTIVNFSQFTY